MQLLAGVDSDSNSEMEFNEEGANSNELAQDEVLFAVPPKYG